MKKLLKAITIALLGCMMARYGNAQAPAEGTLVDDYAIAGKTTDSLFAAMQRLDSFSVEDDMRSIFIGHLFSKNARHAVLWKKVTDSSARVTVLKDTCGIWKPLLATIVAAPSWDAVDIHLEVSDYDGDGIPDLKSIKFISQIWNLETSDLWLYKRDKFIRVAGFDEIANPEFSVKDTKVYGHVSMMGGGSLSFSVYKIAAGRLHKLNEVSCTYYPENQGKWQVSNRKGSTMLVPPEKIYKYVPSYFAESVREYFKNTAP